MAQKIIDDENSLALVEKLIRRVVHDLSNPLSAVVGFAELLSYPNLSAERKERYAQQILEQATKARQILETMAQFCDLGDTSHREFVDPVSLIQTLVGMRFPSHERNNIKVHQDLEGTQGSLWCNRDSIVKILNNLLINAEQSFVMMPQEAQKRILLKIGVLSGSPSMMFFDIVDSGPGIPTEIADSIFEPFYSGRKSGGLGLGLYVSRGLARSMGGDLLLVSQGGMADPDFAGAAFRLLVPLEASVKDAPG